MDHGDVAWMLTSSTIVLLMTPGLAFFYGGLVKRKNIVNTMMCSVAMMGVGAIMWALIGFSLSFSGDVGGIIGDLKWAGLNFDTLTDTTCPYPNTLAFAIFQMMFAIITPAIISGAVIERIKFSSMVLFMALWSLLVYYPLAHMVWGGGIIFDFGAIDFAGGTVVHISSGVSALVLALLVGKRANHGKAAYHPHNVPFVLLGAALLWVGWFGFNTGSELAANELTIHAFMTTNLGAASAMLSWMLIERIKTGKTTLVGTCTGFVVGLVAITPGCGFVTILSAMVIGALVSPICFFMISFLKPRLGYDDALDVFGCHGVGGLWGAIATGIFTKQSINPGLAQWNGLIYGDFKLFVAQLKAIGITLVFAIVGTIVIYNIVKLCTRGVKVSPREEKLGLDEVCHGESAYPAFNGMD
ncbi:MAG: ammonium transporter [Oscillospiraceae bacterium]